MCKTTREEMGFDKSSGRVTSYNFRVMDGDSAFQRESCGSLGHPFMMSTCRGCQAQMDSCGRGEGYQLHVDVLAENI